jgi:hypothetical protein
MSKRTATTFTLGDLAGKVTGDNLAAYRAGDTVGECMG